MITDINVTSYLEIVNTTVDSVTFFSKNSLPDFNRIIVDTNFTNSLGFYFENQVSYAKSIPNNLKKTNFKKYSNSVKDLINTHKQIISVLTLKGDEMKQNLVIKLKDIETNKRKLMYIYNPTLENWFKTICKSFKWIHTIIGIPF